MYLEVASKKTALTSPRLSGKAYRNRRKQGRHLGGIGDDELDLTTPLFIW
jgi:hypothetical protein